MSSSVCHVQCLHSKVGSYLWGWHASASAGVMRLLAGIMQAETLFSGATWDVWEYVDSSSTVKGCPTTISMLWPGLFSCQRVFRIPISVAKRVALGFFLWLPPPLELGDPASLYLHRVLQKCPFYGLTPYLRPTKMWVVTCWCNVCAM